MNRMKGFTLMEILLVLGIMSITMFAVGTTWLGFRGKAQLDSTTRSIVDVLRNAQNNSITNEGFTTWGVHLESSSDPFFEIFSGNDWATGTRHEHFILPKGVTFYTPPKGATSGETVELQITSNSDITVTDGSNVTSGAPAAIPGITTLN